MNDATVDVIYAHYGDDMNIAKAGFENEVARWKERWRNYAEPLRH